MLTKFFCFFRLCGLLV